jgi:uncharacterized phage-like protein YoqJ
MKLAFTGHRPEEVGGFKIPNPTYEKIIKQIELVLNELKPEMVYVGMALGVDTWVADLCIGMRVPFTACIPFKGQELIWSRKDQWWYQDLLNKAKEVVVVCEGGYEPWKMQKRNEFMVDKADVLVAVWNGEKQGGTYNCVKWAEKVGRPIIRINPND